MQSNKLCLNHLQNASNRISILKIFKRKNIGEEIMPKVETVTNDKQSDNPEVIAFPPMLFAGTLLFGLILRFIFPVSFLPLSVSIVLGLSLIMAAGLIARSAFRSMSRAKTAVDPSLPTTAIVSNGIFASTRNPLYLSMTLLCAGIALLFNAVWTFPLMVPLLAVIQNGVIKREERYLERKFGNEYVRYKQSVRRWV